MYVASKKEVTFSYKTHEILIKINKYNHDYKYIANTYIHMIATYCRIRGTYGIGGSSGISGTAGTSSTTSTAGAGGTAGTSGTAGTASDER